MPHVGGAENFHLNGLYDAFCIIVIFPAVVFLGASDIPGDISSRASRFLGNISYPLYITHYPIVYLYLAWVHDAEVPFPARFRWRWASCSSALPWPTGA